MPDLMQTNTSRYSIQHKIMVFMVFGSLCVGGFLLFFIENYANKAADKAFDRLLLGSALTIAGAVQVENNELVIEFPVAALSMLTGVDRVFYSVIDGHGSIVTGYNDLITQKAIAKSEVPIFFNRWYRGEKVRVVQIGRFISLGSQGVWVTIVVAETRDARNALQREIFEQTLWPIVVLLILGIIMTWFMLRAVLRPLHRVEQELKKRTPDVLEPIRLTVPQEISGLVASLNDFMARLEKNMQRLSAVIPDAAHQLRTPLATIRAQAEVARNETDLHVMQTRVERIYKQSAHASQLIQQWLTDVSLTHRMESTQKSYLTVQTLVEEICQSLELDILAKLHVQFDETVAHKQVLGDQIALREMMINVIQNAHLYAPKSRIDVVIEVQERFLILHIKDQGAGISANDKPEVLKRFSRGTHQDILGSGLGLSIVQQVVEAHAGVLELRDNHPCGLWIYIAIPMDRK